MQAPHPHAHSSGKLAFTDPRRFGRILLRGADPFARPPLSALAADPITDPPSAEAFAAKLKKLRASLGDYDSQDIEHHKVLKAIFSLVKKLLRLPGDDAAKEFLLAYTTRLSQADNHSAKYKMCSPRIPYLFKLYRFVF